MTAPDLKFLDTNQPRGLLLDAICGEALRMVGLPYGDTTTAERLGTGGQWRGEVNCFGVLLLVAKEVGLLPPDFDVNIPHETHKQRPAKTILEILRANFERVDTEDLRPADVLLFCWRDCDHRLTEPHHVGLYVAPAVPYGLMVHAQNTIRPHSVIAQRISSLEMRRLEQVWRLK